MNGIEIAITLFVTLFCAGFFTIKSEKARKVLRIALICVIIALLGYGIYDIVQSRTPPQNNIVDVTSNANDNNPIKNFVPELSVVMGDKEVLPDNDFVYLTNEDNITVLAQCNEPICVNWSNSVEFMNEKGFQVNSKGMAILAYFVEYTDAMKRITNEGNIVTSVDPTQLTIPLTDLAKGFYVLGLQGVGATDNLIHQGVEYYSTTRWVYYYFNIQ